MFAIDHVSYFVPNTCFSVETSFERLAITPIQSKIFSHIYGLKNIAIAKEYAVSDMLIQAIQNVLKESQTPLESIHFLIHAHTAKVLTPFSQTTVVQQVKSFFSLTDTLSFGMTLNNCAATFDALELAAHFLTDAPEDAKALIISGEKAFTPSVQVIPNTSITGDAAAACLISLRGKTHRLLALYRLTCGAYAKGIWMEETCAKDFENNYILLLSQVIQEALNQSGINKNQIKWLIPHNVNRISWLRFAQEFHFDRNKIFLNNIEKYGHCFGADIFINYADLIHNQLLQPGDYYLLVTVGLGATFAAAVFQY